MDEKGQPTEAEKSAKAFSDRRMGEAQAKDREGSDASTASTQTNPKTAYLMEKVVQRDNLKEALKRVRANQGSPGTDEMTVEALVPHLREHWPKIKEKLLAGTYEPMPVKRVEIPKAGGGVRMLGIPAVLDRFIQQAILQTLTPLFDPGFSRHSYGFRPGKSAHQAVKAAREYIQQGYEWVVDMDLEKFFDRVNHDVLMGRLAKRIADRRLLRLIRRYLQAGVMAHGVVVERYEGTPQGGPLSPLLSNILLDELDKELEERGHKFARYADDCNIYVKSKRAGERVMASVKEFLNRRLRLKVNETKSAVAKPVERKFLGFSFFRWKGQVRIRIAPQSVIRAKERIRRITGRTRGMSLEEMIAQLNRFTTGWVTYFRISEAANVLRVMDEWTRRRLRCFKIKQWKRRPRTRYREMRALGLNREAAAMFAATRKSWWAISMTPQTATAMPPAYFAKLGLISLQRRYTQLQLV